jgi:DNA-binding NarL/FixJ family response regulator
MQMVINLAAILVADDFRPFRQFICTTLKKSRFRFIEQASDGLEAVRKAAELQPDLILLDIGLPQLNGIEAAKRISKVAPLSKILFVSLETSPDVVHMALNVGGMGYVDKSSISADLLPAIESVLAGRRFVSASLETHQATGQMSTQARNRHEVLFYSEDATLIDGAVRFIAPALRSGNPAIVCATESHRGALIRRLKENGLDLESAIRKGQYISLDSVEVLARVMVNGTPDHVEIVKRATDRIRSASNVANREYPRVAIFGECVNLLCAEGNTTAAINVEKSWNAVLKAHENVDLLCACSLNTFCGDERKAAYNSICKEHSAVHV